jgi:hypothetical protein
VSKKPKINYSAPRRTTAGRTTTTAVAPHQQQQLNNSCERAQQSKQRRKSISSPTAAAGAREEEHDPETSQVIVLTNLCRQNVLTIFRTRLLSTQPTELKNYRAQISELPIFRSSSSARPVIQRRHRDLHTTSNKEEGITKVDSRGLPHYRLGSLPGITTQETAGHSQHHQRHPTRHTAPRVDHVTSGIP